MKMKHLTYFSLLFAAILNTAGQDSKPAQDIVLTVDGTPITMEEMHEMIMTRFGSRLRQIPPAQREAAEQQAQQMVLSDLVARTLLENEANKEGIKVSDAEVDERIAEISKGIPDREQF